MWRGPRRCTCTPAPALALALALAPTQLALDAHLMMTRDVASHTATIKRVCMGWLRQWSRCRTPTPHTPHPSYAHPSCARFPAPAVRQMWVAGQRASRVIDANPAASLGGVKPWVRAACGECVSRRQAGEGGGGHLGALCMACFKLTACCLCSVLVGEATSAPCAWLASSLLRVACVASLCGWPSVRASVPRICVVYLWHVWVGGWGGGGP